MIKNDSTKNARKFENPNPQLLNLPNEAKGANYSDTVQIPGLINTSDEVKDNIYTYHPDIFFAFIDVLGFKRAFEEEAIISASTPSKTENSSNSPTYGNVFTYFFDLINNSSFYQSSETSICYAGQTSDTVYFYTKNPSILLDFLKVYSYLSLHAMKHGIFFRGGISHGSLYVNQPYQFYGDSVINAYQLESYIAKNPVILIDEFTVKKLQGLNEYPDEFIIDYSEKRHILHPFAFWTGNYNLGSLVSNVNIFDIDKSDIKNVLYEKKSKHEYDAKNYSKYIFLLDQFNSIVNKKTDKIIGGNKHEE